MQKLLCIYKSSRLQYTTLEAAPGSVQHAAQHTTEPNPLLYNIVKGFIDVGDRSYKDVPYLIQIGGYNISIIVEDDMIIFAVDNKIHNLNEMLERYDKGDTPGIREMFGTQ